MRVDPVAAPSAQTELLSKVSRYEALFELTGAISAASDIASAAEVLARRIKYVADVISWRYVCFEGDPERPTETTEPQAIVVNGNRGRAEVHRTAPSELSDFEMQLWRHRKTRVLCGDSMGEALDHLPEEFRRADLEQISVNVLVDSGRTQALHLFFKRRQPFSELDAKCLSMISGFFHRKVHTLWERQKLRDLELAFLQQELMLRQSEKLATLGRLSAGMAHELNNPAAAARQGVEQLRTSIGRLGSAQFGLGGRELSCEQLGRLSALEKKGVEGAQTVPSSSLMAGGDLERAVEDWLERNGVQEPWEHASTLVEIGMTAADLEELGQSFDRSVLTLVIEYLSSTAATNTLIADIADATHRISQIVAALKGYSYTDQGPVQLIDVREALDNTLVMLGDKLRDEIDVELDYAADVPRIQAYGIELNQVWTNLMDNAISAMDGAGLLEVKVYEDEGWVVVEVADSGTGIPIEAQEKVFDPFYTTKAPGEGTGLGLSVSHTIVVEKHQGLISVTSKPGATRFTVRLPISGPSLAEESRGSP